MKIIGLRIEKYIDKECSGHNCCFDYTDAEFERHVLCCVLTDNRKVEIELSRSEGECGSGWSCASWGHIIVKEVNHFNGYTHYPKELLIVDDIEPNTHPNVDNAVFYVDDDGGDSYYPGGGYSVKMELFQESSRVKNLRPVWIFKGKSNTGKTYIASKLTELEIYETDCSETLPEVITASVVVLGNKYDFEIADVISKLFGKVDVNIVEFTELNSSSNNE